MKRALFFIILSLAICKTINAQIQDVVAFSYDNLSFDTIGEFTRVSLFECGTIDSIGHPELPRFEVKYVIPLDKQVSGVFVTDSIVQFLQGNYKLYPKQPDIPIGDTISSFVYLDSLVYRSYQPYFKNTIEYVGKFNEFGYQVALFYIYPLNYIPSQHQLQFCSSLSFTIQLSNCNSDFQRPKMESRRMFELTKKLVTAQIRNVSDFNNTYGGPMRIIETNEKVSMSNALLQNDLEVLPEYIVITNDRDINGNNIESYDSQTMTDIFQAFADWKTQKGAPTVVVTIDDICANYIGNDIQNKIHNFLTDVYQEYGTMYVLFGGDVNIVPERITDTIVIHSAQNENRYVFPTDLYYTAIETSWDSNGNGNYGEYPPIDGDSTDNTSEFFHGRAPINNCIEASTFIEKCMTYEKMIGIENRSYVDNVTMMIGALGTSISDYQNYVRNQPDAYLGLWRRPTSNNIPKVSGIIQDNIVRWRLFEDYYQFDQNLPQISYHSIGWENHSMNLCHQNVVASLGDHFPISLQNEIPHIVLHLDHSSYLAMGTSSIHRNETIDRIDVDGFSNRPYYQIIMTLGCSPGEYHKDCIAEHFLNNPNGGTVAIFASSSSSSKEKETPFFSAFVSSLYDYENLLGNTTNAFLYNTGIIHQNYLMHVAGDEWIVFIKRKNHLFGDPELPIWTREPIDLIVSATPSTFTNQDNQFTVSVSGMAYSEYSTNDVDVCVMKDNEVYQRQHYDGTAHSHNFVFEEVNPETAGELKVTVTGHNYIPYETTVPVTITGKNVYIVEQNVMDESGNCDGKLDAGETVNFKIALQNNGTVNLTNVTAILSCEFLD